MSKDQYDELINLVDEMSINYPDDQIDEEPSIDYTNIEQLPEYPFEPYCNELNIILQSGIFHNGKIKGRQISGHAKLYKEYLIIDLKKFIYFLCEKMHDYYPSDFQQNVYVNLLKLEEIITDNIIIIRDIFGKRKAAQLAELANKINDFLETNFNYMEQFKNVFPMKESELADQIVHLFKKHIPNAPDETIYNGVSNFLKLFDINCKPKNLSMRDYRKRKAQRVQDP